LGFGAGARGLRSSHGEKTSLFTLAQNNDPGDTGIYL
jgi:hypothetical protein